MRLVLLSGGYWKDNRDLLSALWCHRVNQARRLVYIPAWPGDESKKDFDTFCRQLQKSTIQKFTYFPLDRKLKPHDYKDLTGADIIFFDGGNTYFLQHWLTVHKLHNWFQKNGKKKVFGGLSAGSIILSPNINLAAIPKSEADEEIFTVTPKSLNFSDFEICPHYESNKKHNQELVDYSKKTPNIILAVPDGSGIIIDSDRIQFLGKITGFVQGKKFKIQN